MIRISDERRLFFSSIARWVTRALGAASIVAGVALKLPAEQSAAMSHLPLFASFQNNAWWILPALLVSVPTADAARRWIDKQTLWPLVKATLEDFKSRIYPAADPQFRHRVTLFKYSSWVWRLRSFRNPGFGWVYIVERTGHTTQNSRTIFRAPNDPDTAEGIAGTTWVSNQLRIIENLPDLAGAGWEEYVANYASDTCCAIEEIQRRRPKSRSLCGIPVEVKGKVWGVLVIDSRDPTIPKRLITTHYQTAAKHLSRLLERFA